MTITQRHRRLRRRARLYLAVWWLPGAAMVARDLLDTTAMQQLDAMYKAEHRRAQEAEEAAAAAENREPSPTLTVAPLDPLTPEYRLFSAVHVALLTDGGRRPKTQANRDARAELRRVVREG